MGQKDYTGHGNSIIVQALPTLCERLKVLPSDSIFLALCPLTSITEDHVKYLTEKGISGAYGDKAESTNADTSIVVSVLY